MGMAASVASVLGGDYSDGFEFQWHLDWVCQDVVAFELIGWHDKWFAADTPSTSFVDLAVTAPTFFPFDIFVDSIVSMIASLSPDLGPLGTQCTYQISVWFTPALCPILSDCVRDCLLCQKFWYRQLQFLKFCWEAGVIS
ncbi:unnamed protein product [Calypogeia fissa]